MIEFEDNRSKCLVGSLEAPIQTLNYAYNIRSWLTNINDVSAHTSLQAYFCRVAQQWPQISFVGFQSEDSSAGLWSDTEACAGLCGGAACIAQANPSRKKTTKVICSLEFLLLLFQVEVKRNPANAGTKVRQ